MYNPLPTKKNKIEATIAVNNKQTKKPQMLKNIQRFQILNYPKWTRFTKMLNAYPLKIHIRYPQVRD